MFRNFLKPLLEIQCLRPASSNGEGRVKDVGEGLGEEVELANPGVVGSTQLLL